MTLSEYKNKFGVTYAHIARLCRVEPATISQIAGGIQTPRFNLAVKIEQATNGQVPRDNWYPPRSVDLNIESVSV